jgi:hypothetical protein
MRKSNNALNGFIAWFVISNINFLMKSPAGFPLITYLFVPPKNISIVTQENMSTVKSDILYYMVFYD